MQTTSPSMESLVLTRTEDLATGTGSAAAMARTVESWHNDTPESKHAGAFSTCVEQPCYSIRRLMLP